VKENVVKTLNKGELHHCVVKLPSDGVRGPMVHCIVNLKTRAGNGQQENLF
jgi:hypothetical protein